MLLLDSRYVFMVILCLELNYYYINPKITPISIDQNRTPIILICVALDLKKIFT